MGKGTSSGKNTAVKQARAVSKGTEGAGHDTTGKNVCLFRFRERFLLVVGNGIQQGDKVAIAPNALDISQLDLIIGAVNCGRYEGAYVERILECIAAKYGYTGAVIEVKAAGNGIEVLCDIAGHSYE